MNEGTPNESRALVAVTNLRKLFPVRKGVLSRTTGHVHAVDGISFSIPQGQTLALVGESGCGKTTTARLVLHLEKPDGGTIEVDGQQTTGLSGAGLKQFRRNTQMIFQDPYSSLNPRKKVRQIVAEPMIVHGVHAHRELHDRVIELLRDVNLSEDYLERYPHELSGGQRQRVGIARALSLSPKVIVCDEPLSALDVSIRSQVINLLLDLQKRYRLTYLFISHDLSVVKHLSDRIAVMYLGKIVEVASTVDFYARPIHPYSEALLSAIPLPDPRAKDWRILLKGEIPSPIHPPSGCRFRTRCPLAQDLCAREEPPLREALPGHLVACHLR